MIETLIKWSRKTYKKIFHSIAFLPAVIGMGFLLLAIVVMEIDNLGIGFKLTAKTKWLSLKDPSTARTIVATVAAGIISLTVFSFSMVMVVINQAASQMSNRMLGNIIGDRVQKIVLGFYIGTIVFSLFLLINISETDSAVTIPSLSVYFLLLLAVFDIFLFIYFLHYITQSFRYENLIQRIHTRTINSLNNSSEKKHEKTQSSEQVAEIEILSAESGYLQGVDRSALLKFASENNIIIKFLFPFGNYILEGTPVLKISRHLEEEDIQKMLLKLDFYQGQEIQVNPYYGFSHLTEVAIKALSPGINDPGTAVLSIHALTNLFAISLKSPLQNKYADSEGIVRIIIRTLSFDELFLNTFLPIWDYGKDDRMVQTAFQRMQDQLLQLPEAVAYTEVIKGLKV